MKLSSTLAGAVLLACGCAHDQAEVLEVPTTTGATIVPNESALRLLSSSRCAHEGACGYVGEGKRYTDAAQCSEAADLDERGAVGVDACPFGVDGDALKRCTDALIAQPCDFPIGTIDHVAPCRRSALCR